MGLIRDSSELREAARLVGGLLGLRRHKEEQPPEEAAFEVEPVAAKEAAVEPEFPGYAEYAASGTRQERIAGVLELLMKRGGYDGAVVTDAEGFVAASVGAGYEEHVLAALAGSLSGCRKRMESAFEEASAGAFTAGLGGARADQTVIEAAGANFLLAGVSVNGEPDTRELTEAARHIGMILGSGVE